MAITATFKTKEGTKTWQVSPSYIMDFDVGIREQDHRGMVRAVGAAG